MKTVHVIGKRITRIKQGIIRRGPSYNPINAVEYLELEDGTRLYPHASVDDSDYSVEMIVNRKNLKIG